MTEPQTIGLLELSSWSLPALLADGACRHTPVQLLGMESTGGDSVTVKLSGSLAAVESALEWCRAEARRLGAETITAFLPRPDASLAAILQEPNAVHPLYGHREQFLPTDYPSTIMQNQPSSSSIGILETVGLTASLEAADVMLKSANVTLVGKEKIGAAHVAIVIRGEVAAVNAAVQAGEKAAAPLGKVIAAHVIARPHPDFLALLPA